MNQTDRDEVKRLIAEHGKGWLPGWAKESVAFAIVMAGAAFIIHSYFPTLIDSQTRGISSDLATVKTDITNINKNVERIDGNIKDLLSKAFDKLLLQGTGKPLSGSKKTGSARGSAELKRDLQFVQRLVETAHIVEYRTDPNSISLVGAKVLDAAFTTDNETNDIAWRTLLEFLNYRSFLNGGVPHPDISQAQFDPRWKMSPPRAAIGPRGPFTVFKVWGQVPIEQAAEVGRVGEPSANVGLGYGPAWGFGAGGNLSLSGARLKNVILQGVTVTYDGVSPVDLQNAFFIDCTFEITRGGNSKPLGRALLAAAKVSVTLS